MMYDIIITENLRFRPSTRILEAGVFKNPYSGDRFRKPALLVHENDVNVWMVGLNFPFFKTSIWVHKDQAPVFSLNKEFFFILNVRLKSIVFGTQRNVVVYIIYIY